MPEFMRANAGFSPILVQHTEAAVSVKISFHCQKHEQSTFNQGVSGKCYGITVLWQ